MKNDPLSIHHHFPSSPKNFDDSTNYAFFGNLLAKWQWQSADIPPSGKYSGCPHGIALLIPGKSI